MPTSQTTPYGSWKSPITSDLTIADAIRLGEPTLAEAVYWLELRPNEGG